GTAIRQIGRDDQHLRFNIVSGAATNMANQTALQGALPKGQVTFQATVVPNSAVSDIFKRYLKEDLHVDFSKVAVLTEANTSYGKSLIQEFEPCKQGAECNGSGEEQGGDPLGLVLPFPMHISRVRSAYEKNKAKNPEHSEDLRATARLALELSLD